MTHNINKAAKLTDGPTSIFIAGEDDELREAVQKKYSVSTVAAPPKSNVEKLIYSQLEQYCDFIFCESTEEYSFYSKEQFNIIAKDKSGGVYGFIGGVGDLIDDSYPIGYVSSEGESGKIAGNFKDLLALIIYYPYWKDLLKCYSHDIQTGIEELKKERLEFTPDYSEVLPALTGNLSLEGYVYSVESLFKCLSEEPQFVVYSKANNSPSGNLLK